MRIFAAVVLLANALFAVAAWPRFLARVNKDARARDAAGRPTRFLIVHRVLIGTALVLAALALIAGVGLLIAP